MNLSMLALALIAAKMLSDAQNTPQKGALDLAELLSDDTKSALDCLEKITSKSPADGDKLGAVLQMMSNPVFLNLTKGIFDVKKAESPPEKQEENLTNDEGYRFEAPSATAREFFRPIDQIADSEIKNKLYRFYDSRYVK